MIAPSNKHFIHGSIFLLSNKLQTAGDKVTGDVTTKQWFLMLYIDGMDSRQPTITNIAREMDSTRQNVTVLLQQLKNKGYVTLSTLPHDHRGQGVSLTDKATEHLAEITRLGETFINRLFKGIDEVEVEVTAHVLQHMFDNLEQMNGESNGRKNDE